MPDWYCTPCSRAGVDRGGRTLWLPVMLILKFGVWPEMSWWVTLWPLYVGMLAVVFLVIAETLRDTKRCMFCGEAL